MLRTFMLIAIAQSTCQYFIDVTSNTNLNTQLYFNAFPDQDLHDTIFLNGFEMAVYSV